MKKTFLATLILFFTPILIVQAKEYQNITQDVEIRYKWYKEIILDGEYYPYKDIMENDRIDENNIKYGTESYWDEKFCELSESFYKIEKKTLNTYKKVHDVKYVVIENIEYNNNVKIYAGNKLIDFKILSYEEQILKIDLKKQYLCDDILLYIYDDNAYKISLYTNNGLDDYIISKEFENEMIVSPDKTWITSDTRFVDYTIEGNVVNDDLIEKIDKFEVCRYREKYVYKYNVKKEYYDDNYHAYIDNYIKDENDYQYFYKGESMVNTVEIIQEKIIKETEPQYIYVEVDSEIKENDSSKENNCKPEIKNNIKTKIVEKEILKIPKIIYIIIATFIIIILYLILKLHKKYVERKK